MEHINGVIGNKGSIPQHEQFWWKEDKIQVLAKCAFTCTLSLEGAKFRFNHIQFFLVLIIVFHG